MKALITDDVHPLLIEGLRGRGYEVTFAPNISFEETLTIISEYEGLVINSKIFCGEELLQQATALKWIARLGSGMEVIDTKFCRELDIQFFNSPEGNCQAVAEHTLGLLLNLMRNISKANAETKNGKWLREQNRGEELSGKTIGIIGFGNTGEAFANTLRGFDVKVLTHDTYRKDFKNNFVAQVSLEEIFEAVDVVSLHLPLTEETTFYANDTFFSSFKKPIYFLNTSRGKVLQTNALLEAMENKLVKAAALDVLENENLAKFTDQQKGWWRELVSSERIILTPHIAGWTHESKQRMAEVILEKLSLLNF